MPEDDPYDELISLRIYTWVQEYLERRGWQRAGKTQWFVNPDFETPATLGFALEIALVNDGIDLEMGPGKFPNGGD